MTVGRFLVLSCLLVAQMECAREGELSFVMAVIVAEFVKCFSIPKERKLILTVESGS